MNLKSSLTPLEVSELLKITKNTVYELIKRGELPSYKIGKKIRIDMHDVEEYINNQKSNSKPSINRNIINNSLNNNISNITTNNISLNNPTNSEIIISGQDILLDVLARYIEEILPDYTILRSYKGSYNGLYDLYNNKVSIASCHLWDGDNDSYNFDYVKRLLPGTPCILVNLAYRLQGFYVAKGNPLNINSFEDLTNKNIKFINREKGSGVRVLLDEKLRLLNIDPNSINGYYKEVLAWVASGNADVGFVYLSDALSSDSVSIVENVDEVNDHSPITYPVSVIKASNNIDEAKKFEDFLFTDEAQKIFEKYGYKVNS